MGNAQGYAGRGGKIAISPLAVLPEKALFHEVAYCLLHGQDSDLTDTEQTPRYVAEVEAEAVALLYCESLGLPGVEFSRDYIVVVLMLWSRVKGAGLLGFDGFQRNINERAKRAVVRFTPQGAIRTRWLARR